MTTKMEEICPEVKGRSKPGPKPGFRKNPEDFLDQFLDLSEDESYSPKRKSKRDRKEQNRASAVRFRERRKKEFESLSQEVQRLREIQKSIWVKANGLLELVSDDLSSRVLEIITLAGQ